VFWGWGEASDRALRERTPWSESRWRYITTRGTEEYESWLNNRISVYCPHQPKWVGGGSVCTYTKRYCMLALTAVIAFISKQEMR
jgi:hypothetical protein